jgi:Uma2 family endonuclease
MATAGRRQAGVRSRRFSKREYYRMGELGFFRGQRVELIEGQIMVLSPQNAPHGFYTDRVARVLGAVFGQAYWVRMQLPLDISQTTEPEPDVSVVLGTPDQFRNAHPTNALLIVEVSDTTVSYDRRRKGSLYARAGVEDYWIVNLKRGWLEVCRAPVPDGAERYGFRYSTRTDLLAGMTVTPLALPGVSIPVIDLVG